MGTVETKNAGKTVLNSFFTKLKRKSLPFSYEIRRSSRAKKTRIVVTGRKIEVVAPMKVAEQKIHDFVFAQKNWVEEAVKKMQSRLEDIVSFAPDKYRDGAKVPFRGEYFTLTIKFSQRRRIKIEFEPSVGFVAHFPAVPEVSSNERNELLKNALIKWMKEQAKQESHRYIRKHAERYRLYPRSVRIKTQKSRWGSCGIRDDINLNWLLMMAPPPVMEYVVVHELCHLRHRNHSKDFWQLVGEHIPDYRQHRNWLKQHGQRLMLGL